jgi:isopentenyldiphosphate isomerase
MNELSAIRLKLKSGDSASQAELDQLQTTLAGYQPQKKSEEEIFHLVDTQGKPTGLSAPRWLCHLLGLRHRSVHVLLEWESPSLGNVFIFQVRSWQKADYPGCVDISVGGHVTADGNSVNVIDAAYREMKEELGLGPEDLLGKELVRRAGYAVSGGDESRNFFNAEWCEVYTGLLDNDGFHKLNFLDAEVVGIYLCPEAGAKRFLEQEIIPIAAGLKASLEYFLKA